MRELGKLLMNYRQLCNNEKIEFKSYCILNILTMLLLSEICLDTILQKKTFRAPSLAMHLGGPL
jgi:hypothetical protein